MIKKVTDTDLKPGVEAISTAIVQSEKLFSTAMGNIDVFRKMFMSSPIPAFLFKKNQGGIALIDFSVAAVSLVSSEAVHSSPCDMTSAINFFSDKPEIVADISRCFSERFSSSRELPHRRKDSDRNRCFRFTYTLLDPNTLLVYVEEISEKKLILSVLREQQERLELAINATGSGLWDWNVASGDLFFNDKWATMLDYDPREINKHIVAWEGMLHPDDKSRVIESLQRHLRGKADQYRDEHRLYKKKGGWIWVLDTGKVTARDASGNPVRAIGAKIDISDRKHLEEELHRHNRRLAKEVAEKTAALMKKELLLRKKETHANNQSMRLEKLNNALKNLQKGIQSEKIEENVRANINEIVIPYLDHIAATRRPEDRKTYIELLRTNLNTIASPVSNRLNALHRKLTPTETRVSDFVRHGKSTKEISDLMCVSIKTVKTHRRNIRKKLGLNGQSVNLTCYLRSIQ